MSQQTTEVTTTSASSVKRPLDLYTLMMLISFLAMLAGTILLIIELSHWGNFSELPWNTSSATANLN